MKVHGCVLWDFNIHILIFTAVFCRGYKKKKKIEFLKVKIAGIWKKNLGCILVNNVISEIGPTTWVYYFKMPKAHHSLSKTVLKVGIVSLPKYGFCLMVVVSAGDWSDWKTKSKTPFAYNLNEGRMDWKEPRLKTSGCRQLRERERICLGSGLWYYQDACCQVNHAPGIPRHPSSLHPRLVLHCCHQQLMCLNGFLRTACFAHRTSPSHIFFVFFSHSASTAFTCNLCFASL